MDCLYNAYCNHVKHLGLKTRDTRAIFYAMRSSILPEWENWNTRANVVGRKKKKKHNNIQPKGSSHAGLAMPGARNPENEIPASDTNEIIVYEYPPLTEAEIQEMIEEDMLIDALSKIEKQEDGFDPTDAFATADENGMIDGRPWYEQNDDFWEQNGFLIEDDSGLFLPNPGATISKEVVGIVEKSKQPSREKWVQDALDDDWENYPAYSSYFPRSANYSSGLRMAFTPTAAAPWIIRTLARLDGLNVKMEQWSWYNAESLMQEAETDAERQIIMTSDYGKEVDRQEDISLEPAIYCVTSSKHAQFGVTKPKTGVIALAIQLSLPTTPI